MRSYPLGSTKAGCNWQKTRWKREGRPVISAKQVPATEQPHPHNKAGSRTPPTPSHPQPPSPLHFRLSHSLSPSAAGAASSPRLRWPASGSGPRCTRCSRRRAWPSASAPSASSATSPATQKSGKDLDCCQYPLLPLAVYFLIE
ncbi:hypothetical protein VPH35_136375 [Triticum aestivum]